MYVQAKPVLVQIREGKPRAALLSRDQNAEAKQGRPPGGKGKFNQMTRKMGTWIPGERT